MKNSIFQKNASLRFMRIALLSYASLSSLSSVSYGMEGEVIPQEQQNFIPVPYDPYALPTITLVDVSSTEGQSALDQLKKDFPDLTKNVNFEDGHSVSSLFKIMFDSLPQMKMPSNSSSEEWSKWGQEVQKYEDGFRKLIKLTKETQMLIPEGVLVAIFNQSLKTIEELNQKGALEPLECFIRAANQELSGELMMVQNLQGTFVIPGKLCADFFENLKHTMPTHLVAFLEHRLNQNQPIPVSFAVIKKNVDAAFGMPDNDLFFKKIRDIANTLDNEIKKQTTEYIDHNVNFKKAVENFKNNTQQEEALKKVLEYLESDRLDESSPFIVGSAFNSVVEAGFLNNILSLPNIDNVRKIIKGVFEPMLNLPPMPFHGRKAVADSIIEYYKGGFF